MAGEWHGRGMGTACYVWIGLKGMESIFQDEPLIVVHQLRTNVQWAFSERTASGSESAPEKFVCCTCVLVKARISVTERERERERCQPTPNIWKITRSYKHSPRSTCRLCSELHRKLYWKKASMYMLGSNWCRRLWVKTPCTLEHIYQYLGRSLPSLLKMEAMCWKC